LGNRHERLIFEKHKTINLTYTNSVFDVVFFIIKHLHEKQSRLLNGRILALKSLNRSRPMMLIFGKTAIFFLHLPQIPIYVKVLFGDFPHDGFIVGFVPHRFFIYAQRGAIAVFKNDGVPRYCFFTNRIQHLPFAGVQHL